MDFVRTARSQEPMRPPPPTAHEYFEQLSEDRQAPMAQVRQMIRRQWPKAKEDMSYGMPTYLLNDQPVFALASQKNHITFYVLPFELLNAFKHDLRTRNCGKSCIRFRRLETEDMDLLERIVMYVGTTCTDDMPQLKMFSRV
jgi:uncharacterized protein YdhG (YjbR/CyaY superfamily)